MSSPIDPLLAQRQRFRRFLVARLGNEADADDLLQTSLVKALRASADVRDDHKLTAWFYQVLRHAMIDHARSRGAAAHRDDAWSHHQSVESDAEAQHDICACFEALLPELKPREAELLRRVELEGDSVAEVARALGMSANHASVTLHRARRSLRERLEAFCGSCASSACLECDCAE